jgi:hypothetical protein
MSEPTVVAQPPVVAQTPDQVNATDATGDHSVAAGSLAGVPNEIASREPGGNLEKRNLKDRAVEALSNAWESIKKAPGAIKKAPGAIRKFSLEVWKSIKDTQVYTDFKNLSLGMRIGLGALALAVAVPVLALAALPALAAATDATPAADATTPAADAKPKSRWDNVKAKAANIASNMKAKAANIRTNFMALSTFKKVGAVALAVVALAATVGAFIVAPYVTLAVVAFAAVVKFGPMIYHSVKNSMKKEETAGETNPTPAPASTTAPKKTLLQKLKTVDTKSQEIGANIKAKWKDLSIFKKFVCIAAPVLTGIIALVALSFPPVAIVSALVTVALIVGTFVYLGSKHKPEEKASTATAEREPSRGFGLYA